MSGIEVAGLVLGAIPLVIVAVDRCKAAHSPVKIFFKYKNSLDTLINELQLQTAILHNSIAALLQSAGVDQTALLPAGNDDMTTLRKTDAEEDIRSYLGSHYEDFIGTVVAYRDDVFELAATLRKPATAYKLSGKTCEEILDAQRRPDGGTHFRGRLKFTMSKRQIETLVKDLNKRGQLLKRFCISFRLLHNATTPTPSRKAGKLAKSLVNIRAEAQRLFDTISVRWKRCHPKHGLNIRLEPRLENAATPSHRDRHRYLTFCISMAVPRAVSTQSLPWFETRVIPRRSNAPELVPKSIKLNVIHIDCADEWPGKDVTVESVSDICWRICEAEQAQQSLLFFVDAHDELRAFEDGSRRVPVPCTEEHRPVSLNALLDRRMKGADCPTLNRTERVRVAKTLASAVFQLSGTAWMISGPLKNRVQFSLDPQAASSTHRAAVDSTKPFISTTRFSAQGHKLPLKASLLELGIVLLELWHDMTFEHYCDEESLPVSNDYYDRHTQALRWFQDTEADMLRHSQAVSFCMGCLSMDMDFDNQSFREKMFAEVMQPLIDNVQDVS